MTTEIQVLIFFAIGVLWYMWRRIKRSLQHLEDSELRDFIQNRLGKNDLKRVREHLLSCDQCKDRLDEIQKETHRPNPDRWLKRRF